MPNIVFDVDFSILYPTTIPATHYVLWSKELNRAQRRRFRRASKRFGGKVTHIRTIAWRNTVTYYARDGEILGTEPYLNAPSWERYIHNRQILSERYGFDDNPTGIQPVNPWLVKST